MNNKYLKNKPKPFSRALARVLDYCFFYSLFILPLFFASLIPHDFLHLAIMLLVPLFWIPCEALLISLTGTTPGKALLGIRVRDKNGKLLNFRKSLKRSFSVWKKGLCFNIPPFNIFSTIRHLKKLKKNKCSDWDDELGISIYVKRKRKFRTIFAGALVFVYSLFFFSEYELREVLISDQSCFTSKMFKKQDGKWVAFKDPDGTFHIDFPSNPETKESLLPTTKGKDPLPFSEIKFLNEEIEYSLSYTTLPKSITKWSSGLVLKGSLKLLAKHLAGGAKIHKKSTSKFKKHPSIDFILLKKGDLESMGRLILIGSRLYKVEVTYPSHKREVVQESSNIFMQSFEPKG